MLSINLKKENKVICKAELIQVEQSNEDISIIHLKYTDLSSFSEYLEKKLIIDILFDTEKYGMVIYMKGIIYPQTLEQNNDYITITGDFIISDDYNPYDQELINHIYKYWKDSPSNLIDRSSFSEKDFCLYLDTLSIYHNFPEQIQFKSNYIFDSDIIVNKCDLFIQIGELFAGKQIYFCHGLDILEKSLKYHFKSINSKIPFEIRNKNLIIQKVGKDYFETMLEVMNPFFEFKW